MRRSPLKRLGAVAVATIVAATSLATIAAVRHAREDLSDRRAVIAAPSIQAIAADVSGSAASVEHLRGVRESGQTLTQEGFARVAAAPLERQESLAYLSFTPTDGSAPLVALGADTPSDIVLEASPALATLGERARDTAATVASSSMPSPSGERVAALVSAVYAPGAPLDTVAQRREALLGHIVGALRLSVLDGLAQEGLPDGARVSVLDGEAVVLGAGGGTSVGSIGLDGRRWDVTLSGVDDIAPALPIAIALGGLLLTGVVALLFIESASRERAASDELEMLQVRHDLILASAGDGIIGVDAAGRARLANPAAARMLGADAHELTGEALASSLPFLAEPLATGEGRSGEETLRRRDGSEFPAEFTVTPIGGGAADAFVVTFRDVSARRALEAQRLADLETAERRAAIDPLTRLANHRTFHERLPVEVERARRRGRTLSLVMMDLDHFKQVNDRHGHQAGDLVLERAARILEAETRAGELVARVGGEEFAMIIPDADEAEAMRAAERVRAAIAGARFPVVDRMTISAGVAGLAPDEDADALYRLADRALYRAKHAGRDRVVRSGS